MAEYIERDEAIRKALDACIKVVGHGITQFDAVNVVEIIESIPIADVVEVVRCKDCDVPHNKWTGCPHLNGLIPPPDFYCAKGTPKERGWSNG